MRTHQLKADKGRHLIDLIKPWGCLGGAVAIDSAVLQARGGVWHQKHREKGEIPHTSMDIQGPIHTWMP